MILDTIGRPETVLSFDDELFNETTSDIFVVFGLGTVLENVVDEGFAEFLVQELERFLNLWKFDIFVLDGVDEMTAFE
jgi:hypothetical protein